MSTVTVLLQVQKSLASLLSPGCFLVRVRRPAGGGGARLAVSLLEAGVGNSPLAMAAGNRVRGHPKLLELEVFHLLEFRPFLFVTSSTPQDLTLGGEATLGADSTCLSVNLEDLDMTGDVSLRPVRRVAAAGSGVRVTNGSAAAVRRSETLDDSDDYNSLDMTKRARLADDYMTNRLPPCAPPLSPSNLLGNDDNSPIIRPYPRYRLTLHTAHCTLHTAH